MKSALCLALSWLAGYVDAIGYVILSHVFVGNMTGNTIAAAVGLDEGRWFLLFRRGFAVPVYFVGMLASRILIARARRSEIPRLPVAAFLLEAICLAVFILVARSRMLGGVIPSTVGSMYYLLVALPSFAMGLQNALATRFGPVEIHTTHITGTLAKLAKMVVNGGEWALERRSAPDRPRWLEIYREGTRRDGFRGGLLLACAWTVYLGGAITSLLIRRRWGVDALWISVALLGLIILLELFPRRTTAAGHEF